MKKSIVAAIAVAVLALAVSRSVADSVDGLNAPDFVGSSPDLIYADEAAATEKSAEPQKGPPLPFHTIEGYGGGAITPMAYLVNPPLGDHTFGQPAIATSYVNLGQKDLEAFTVTENILGRVELGFGADRLNLGRLPDDIVSATGVNIGIHDEWLFNVNARGLLLPENSFDSKWVPAVTAGVHYKYNNEIAAVNNDLGGALTSIGYRHDDGVDFTLTASKTLPDVLGRPLIASGGVRLSEAAQLGTLGFGDSYAATFEGNLAYLPTNWLLIAYEFRQKNDPYGTIPGLVGKEENWHAFDVSWLANSHLDVVGGVGYFGLLANSRADAAFWVELKYEW